VPVRRERGEAAGADEAADPGETSSFFSGLVFLGIQLQLGELPCVLFYSSEPAPKSQQKNFDALNSFGSKGSQWRAAGLAIFGVVASRSARLKGPGGFGLAHPRIAKMKSACETVLSAQLRLRLWRKRRARPRR
jgi:hypothetical protein